MQKAVKTHALLCILSLICSCNKGKDVQSVLEAMEGRRISLPLSEMRCIYHTTDTDYTISNAYDYRMLVYVDSSVCTPCSIDRLWKWNKTIEERQNVDFLFIVAPRHSQKEDVFLSLEFCGLKKPVYVDTSYVFRRENPQWPDQSKYHTVLLNREHNIILVGNPIENPVIDSLFLNVVTQ